MIRQRNNAILANISLEEIKHKISSTYGIEILLLDLKFFLNCLQGQALLK